MQIFEQKPIQTRTGKKTGIWLAFAIALGLHTIVLILPITRQSPLTENVRPQIELQLTTFSSPPHVPPAPVHKPVPEPEIILPEPAPVPVSEVMPEATMIATETPSETEPLLLTSAPKIRDPEDMGETEKSRMTSTILARQFITEESAADRIFGKPLEQDRSGTEKEFHYPLRQDMISMLKRPMQDIPFAYEPGLVYFAYDPGVKGDLQRFWDVITPEFGWRTNNGTEFRCILVLVIVGCAWK